ncbi:MAG: XdhC family protein, partial [Candidatus Izemoplasmatales bacterium]|nr:XdhC family protein [Candidatus Izemoplasmatales bacterium]
NEIGVSSQTFYVVCTPSHTQDYHVLNKVLESGVDFRYLGLLCSPQKLDDYLTKTYEVHTKQVRLANFYAPIGLDLGGNRPEDIAISIASEILAIANQRPNQMHMRESRHGTYRYWENE